MEAREANIRAGYVYVISNIGAFGERVVKVGMTRRLDPMDRVRELGDASVPFRFDVHALIFCEDAVGLEAHLHREFADRRVNQVNTRREFFYASPAEVREILSRIAGSGLLLEFNEIAEALEWRASGAQLTQTQPAAAGEAVTEAARQLLAQKTRGGPTTTSGDAEEESSDASDAAEIVSSSGEDVSVASPPDDHVDDDTLSISAGGDDDVDEATPVTSAASSSTPATRGNPSPGGGAPVSHPCPWTQSRHHSSGRQQRRLLDPRYLRSRKPWMCSRASCQRLLHRLPRQRAGTRTLGGRGGCGGGMVGLGPRMSHDDF